MRRNLTRCAICGSPLEDGEYRCHSCGAVTRGNDYTYERLMNEILLLQYR